MKVIGQTKNETIIVELDLFEFVRLIDFPTSSKELGERIANYRKQHKLSQGDLALLIGISRTYLSLIENGREEISFRIYKRIVAVIEADD